MRIAAVAAALVITSLLPARMLGWASYLADPVQAVVAPWEQTLRRLAGWIGGRGARSTVDGIDAGMVEELIRQRDQAQFALIQANAQIEELRRRISEVARGMELNNLPVAPVMAPVIGASPDLSNKAMTVRAGRRQGVEENNVAVVGGVHIVGLVKRVSDRTSIVLPLTDRSAGLIDGRIMLDSTAPGPMVRQLTPDGQGRLVGVVEDDPRLLDAQGRPPMIAPGMRVRLFDRAWPQSAQGLIVGQVVNVEPSPSQPLRPVVTVAPIEPIEKISEVTIRTQPEGIDAGAGAAAPGVVGPGGTP